MSLEELAAQAAIETTATTGEPGAPVDNANPAGEPAQSEAAITNAQALAGAVGAAREAFCYFTKLQSPRAVLTEEKVAQIGAMWGPVLDKYGINVGAVMGDYMLEFTAVVGTIGIAMELRAAVRAELATIAATSEKKQPDGASIQEQ